MSSIINSTYEIIRELGSGGGGVAYLANHLRLNKKVVLKADRRKVWFNSAKLRREVDILKELSHTYIPQVYDYFIDQDTAFTVIDYIEGESLDKPLKRGERFSQKQVIEWAIQILEALDYLHSPIHGNPPRGFVHSDIKPANIMLKPNGNICLIDFNIALALGEENAVGRSAGYSSPEHYGLDYSSGDYQTGGQLTIQEETVTEDDSSTIVASEELTTGNLSKHSNEKSSGGESYSSRKKILPDVRSDIYSLGATLYHLLSGKRPEQNAQDVVPLSKQEFSPQIVDIITKAMNPNPDLRYQSAKEMQEAFFNLWTNDIRMKRRKRINVVATITCGCLLAIGVFLVFTGLKRLQTREQWLKLAEYSENALENGDSVQAIDYALQALDKTSGIFQPEYLPEAQKALTDALGVYDLSDGFHPHMAVELPTKPLFMELSPDGTTVTSLCSDLFVVTDTDSGETVARLPAEQSALSEAEYLDNHTILYAGEEGISAYDLNTQRVLWTGEPATAICISGDHKSVVGLYKDNTYAVVYDSLTGTEKGRFDFGTKHQHYIPVYDYYAGDEYLEPNRGLLALNEDGTLLGISFSDGTLALLSLQNSEDETFLELEEGFPWYEGGFYQEFFVYSAISDGASFINSYNVRTSEYANCTKNSRSYPYRVHIYDGGVLYKLGNLTACFDPQAEDTEDMDKMAETNEIQTQGFASDGNYTAIGLEKSFAFYDKKQIEMNRFPYPYSADFVLLNGGKAIIGSMNTTQFRVLDSAHRLEGNILSYDPQLRHSEARISGDGNRIMLFSVSGFIIFDEQGNIRKQVNLPDPGLIYDQQFRRNDEKSWLEVTYYDGRVVSYDAADGKLLSEEQGDAPDRSLLETFETSEFRIRSSLLGPPEVYRKDTGEFVQYLSEEAYLTYITETDNYNYLIAQYTTYDLQDNYGILMNKDCDVLAKLPHLCDVIDKTLYFDYPSGYIRSVNIYNLEQLSNLARSGKEADKK